MSTQLQLIDAANSGPRPLSALRRDLDACIVAAEAARQAIEDADILDNTDYWQWTLDPANDQPNFNWAIDGCWDEIRKFEDEALHCEQDNDTLAEDAAYESANMIRTLEKAFVQCLRAWVAIQNAERREIAELRKAAK